MELYKYNSKNIQRNYHYFSNYKRNYDKMNNKEGCHHRINVHSNHTTGQKIDVTHKSDIFRIKNELYASKCSDLENNNVLDSTHHITTIMSSNSFSTAPVTRNLFIDHAPSSYMAFHTFPKTHKAKRKMFRAQNNESSLILEPISFPISDQNEKDKKEKQRRNSFNSNDYEFNKSSNTTIEIGSDYFKKQFVHAPTMSIFHRRILRTNHSKYLCLCFIALCTYLSVSNFYLDKSHLYNNSGIGISNEMQDSNQIKVDETAKNIYKVYPRIIFDTYSIPPEKIESHESIRIPVDESKSLKQKGGTEELDIIQHQNQYSEGQDDYNLSSNVDKTQGFNSNNEESVFDTITNDTYTVGARISNWDKDCVIKRPWQSNFYPTCNIMHEFDITTGILPNRDNDALVTNQFQMISTGGSIRLTWKLDLASSYSKILNRNNEAYPNEYVLKMLRIDREFNKHTFESNRIDSIAMERLSKSPHVMNEYSFCGQSVITEFAHGHSNSLAKRKKLTSMNRLVIAKDLLEGLSHIHGIDYFNGENATLVHNDINPSNIVQINNSSLKYNDFNVGVLPRWNNVKNEQCRFPHVFDGAMWRAPEEIMNKTFVTEKADVYSVGNILFQLLTKREPWNHLEPERPPTQDEIKKRKLVGGLPFVPASVLESNDPAIQSIHLAMLSCYTFYAEKRPSAKQISDNLKVAIALIKEEKNIEKIDLLKIFGNP